MFRGHKLSRMNEFRKNRGHKLSRIGPIRESLCPRKFMPAKVYVIKVPFVYTGNKMGN